MHIKNTKAIKVYTTEHFFKLLTTNKTQGHLDALFLNLDRHSELDKVIFINLFFIFYFLMKRI